MHFTVLQENVLKAIQDASRFISSKPQLPILSGIYLSAEEGQLVIRSTDLRVGFHTSIGGKIERSGDCVVPAKVFTDFISSLPHGPLECEIIEGNLCLTQGRAKAKIPTFPATDFPPFPQLNTKGVEFQAADFFEIVEQTGYAASLDETRPVLASVYFEFQQETCSIVSTDGYRLVVSNYSMKSEGEGFNVLINAKTLLEVLRALVRTKPSTVEFGVSKELQQVRIAAGETQVLIRLTEGDFPPYNQIIPSSFLIRTFLDRQDLLNALKTTMVVARESSSIISMTLEGKNLTVAATSATMGENEVTLDSTYNATESKKISFNAKFLTDALLHMKTERVEFCMNSELKPALLLPENQENYLTVIMPFKR